MRALVLLGIVCACASAQTPVAVLVLSVEGTTFHVGERIPVTLQFTNRGSSAIRFEERASLRRIRPQGPDVFSASPSQDVIDPLDDLFAYLDGWPTSTNRLGPGLLDAGRSFSLQRDLNEYLVFRKPGQYKVRVASTRVVDQAVNSPLQSNTVEIAILPRDETWSARQYQSAKDTLLPLVPEPPPHYGQIVMADASRIREREAVRTLRFLETEEAAHLLASLYGRGLPEDTEVEMGLWASPRRPSIVSDLDRHLRNRDLPVTNVCLGRLLELVFRQTERDLGRPLTRMEMDNLSQRYEQVVLDAAPGKFGSARGITYWHLFLTTTQQFAKQPAVRAGLIGSFFDLPPSLIGILLGSNWLQFGGSDLVPVLKEALSRPWPDLHPPVEVAVFARLRELDPESARKAALQDMLQDHGKIPDASLFPVDLPKSSELDRALLEQYRQGQPVEARLARYASDAIAQTVLAIYRQRMTSANPAYGYGCLSPVWAYLFRATPVDALGLLASARTLPAINAMKIVTGQP